MSHSPTASQGGDVARKSDYDARRGRIVGAWKREVAWRDGDSRCFAGGGGNAVNLFHV